jgi:hypothetical protein
MYPKIPVIFILRMSKFKNKKVSPEKLTGITRGKLKVTYRLSKSNLKIFLLRA